MTTQINHANHTNQSNGYRLQDRPPPQLDPRAFELFELMDEVLEAQRNSALRTRDLDHERAELEGRKMALRERMQEANLALAMAAAGCAVVTFCIFLGEWWTAGAELVAIGWLIYRLMGEKR